MCHVDTNKIEGALCLMADNGFSPTIPADQALKCLAVNGPSIQDKKVYTWKSTKRGEQKNEHNL